MVLRSQATAGPLEGRLSQLWGVWSWGGNALSEPSGLLPEWKSWACECSLFLTCSLYIQWCDRPAQHPKPLSDVRLRTVALHAQPQRQTGRPCLHPTSASRPEGQLAHPTPPRRDPGRAAHGGASATMLCSSCCPPCPQAHSGAHCPGQRDGAEGRRPRQRLPGAEMPGHGHC